MATVTMTMEEYLQLLNGLSSDMSMDPGNSQGNNQGNSLAMPKRKRSTAYQRRYKAAFKKVSPRFKLKSGKWKKNGFKMAVKMAHKMAKK